MTTDAIRDLRELVPFRPFDLVLPHGERVHVPHPECLAVFPDTTIIVVAGVTGQPMRLIDAAQVSAAEIPARSARSTANP